MIDQCILEDFCNIAFGAVYQNREELIGNSSMTLHYNAGNKKKEHKHQGHNFRSLLLSCFKPHGGLDRNHSAFYEQDVLFVDISRMSAADILTIHQKLALIDELLKPGQPGCSQFIIVCGDQPTYRMLVQIWRKSYLEDRREGHCSDSVFLDARVHEWLIPFPGFFHFEKQSLYPLCKKMLDGLGLNELAECSGLSKSQVDNILKHSHARNNRAVLFDLCAALMIHTIDLVQTECPDLEYAIKKVKSESGSDKANLGCRERSRLLRFVTEKITNSILEIGKLCRERVSSFFEHFSNIARTGDTS